jgi:hypothetical protein
MKNNMKSIDKMVFVATLPRSGSSMDCGILEACGAFGGHTIGSVPANPKGIYENQGLNNMCLKPIFDELEVRNPHSLFMFHRSGGPPADLFDWFNRDMVYGLNRQGYRGGVAYFKNGIFTFLFNRINEVFPDAIWVLPNRDNAGVKFSHSRIYKNKPKEVIDKEINDYRAMYEHIQEVAGDRAWLIDNDKVIDGDFAQIKELVEHLGLEWNEEGVRDWVDPKMWGDRPDREPFEEGDEKPKVRRNSGNNGR